MKKGRIVCFDTVLSILTHILTHNRKNRCGDNGSKSAIRNRNPR